MIILPAIKAGDKIQIYTDGKRLQVEVISISVKFRVLHEQMHVPEILFSFKVKKKNEILIKGFEGLDIYFPYFRYVKHL